MDLSTALLAALLCAEVAAVGLAAWHAREPDRSVELAIGTYKLNPRTAARFRRWRWRFSPLVVLLTFALADELAQLCLHAALDGAPRPLADWYRAAWQVSIALSLGWPAALAWAAQKTDGPGALCGVPEPSIRQESPPRPRTGGETSKARAQPSTDLLLGGYFGILAGLAIVYPPSRAGLRWTLLAWELACVALAWWGLWRRRLTPWGAAEVVLVVLVACESAVVLVGPFASDPFTRWWIARAFYLGAWGAVCGVLARAPRTA